MIDRRGFVVSASVATLLGGSAVAATAEGQMYGMIGKVTTKPGQREALARLLLSGSAAMPGCLSYVVSEDLANADALWVSEAWDSKESHAASLSLPAVRAAIAAARPLIAGFDTAAELRPIGGVGLGRG
ncbi:antibiotic biosynthesis monooxygenase [Sphingomonas sp. SUN019]|uniref:putative quinol monooxygenase n=1 Tax=Sphingomonas sp. SUN019 TaxID=2937788 RepID=UPI0021648792|nr:antibiotic biosynthesis monooxygenase family protein [Sphingomonas sp. SUN019]UVO52126.1 antibiotic biosynthesis monooxygenase [Sphingomonas sp. SUN019]